MTPESFDPETVARVYWAAKGYGEALATHHSSVRQVIALAGGDRSVIEAARQRARAEADAAAAEPTTGVSDAVEAAPALVAFKLLDEAIAELDREGR